MSHSQLYSWKLRTLCLQAVAGVSRDLTGVSGFEPPSWRELVMGARPEPREHEDFEPGCTRDGWQHEASSRMEETFRAESLFPRMDDSGKALLRSQGGPGAGLALSTCPMTSFTPQLFRVILLRRLHFSIVRNCWPLDSRGHHRAACARSGCWEVDLVGPHVDDGRKFGSGR